jgi:hypothetical protein
MSKKKIRKCHIKEGDSKKKCPKLYFAIVKVQIFHPESLRKSWQTWYLCKKHFFHFIEDKGEGWYCYYNKAPEKKCPVINYKVPEMGINSMNSINDFK